MKKLLYVLLACVIVAIAGIVIHKHKTNSVNHDVLVAYFSATGNTEFVAEKLANVINADLFEIVPEQLYTNDDLNWQNDNSRSSVEMRDKNSRPAIASKVANMAQYKIVFVGFPIWWGREPSIIDTFLTSYDFNGKTIIPFATSGSTPTTKSAAENMRLIVPTNVPNGARFPVDVSIEDLKHWASEWVTE